MPGPGHCHFPVSYAQEFFQQLISEEVRTRFVRGHPVRYWFPPPARRNEALDRRVYALAALYARWVPWEVLIRAAPTEPPPPQEPPGGGPPPTAPPRGTPQSPAQIVQRGVRYRFRLNG